jgi:hypothetical protein
MKEGYSVLEAEEETQLTADSTLNYTSRLSRKVKLIYLVITLVLVVSLAVVVGFYLTAPHPPSLSRAEILLDTYPLIDGHNDVPWTYRRASENSVLQIDFSKNIPNWQTDLPRLISGKVGGQFWSVYVPCDFQGKDAVRATLEQIDVVKKNGTSLSDFSLCLYCQ